MLLRLLGMSKERAGWQAGMLWMCMGGPGLLLACPDRVAMSH